MFLIHRRFIVDAPRIVDVSLGPSLICSYGQFLSRLSRLSLDLVLSRAIPLDSIFILPDFRCEISKAKFRKSMCDYATRRCILEYAPLMGDT